MIVPAINLHLVRGLLSYPSLSTGGNPIIIPLWSYSPILNHYLSSYIPRCSCGRHPSHYRCTRPKMSTRPSVSQGAMARWHDGTGQWSKRPKEAEGHPSCSFCYLIFEPSIGWLGPICWHKWTHLMTNRIWISCTLGGQDQEVICTPALDNSRKTCWNKFKYIAPRRYRLDVRCEVKYQRCFVISAFLQPSPPHLVGHFPAVCWLHVSSNWHQLFWAHCLNTSKCTHICIREHLCMYIYIVLMDPI